MSWLFIGLLYLCFQITDGEYFLKKTNHNSRILHLQWFAGHIFHYNITKELQNLCKVTSVKIFSDDGSINSVHVKDNAVLYDYSSEPSQHRFTLLMFGKQFGYYVRLCFSLSFTISFVQSINSLQSVMSKHLETIDEWKKCKQLGDRHHNLFFLSISFCLKDSLVQSERIMKHGAILSRSLNLEFNLLQILRRKSDYSIINQLDVVNVHHVSQIPNDITDGCKDDTSNQIDFSWPLSCNRSLYPETLNRYRRYIESGKNLSKHEFPPIMWYVTSGRVRMRREIFFSSITALMGTPPILQPSETVISTSSRNTISSISPVSTSIVFSAWISARTVFTFFNSFKTSSTSSSTNVTPKILQTSMVPDERYLSNSTYLMSNTISQNAFSYFSASVSILISFVTERKITTANILPTPVTSLGTSSLRIQEDTSRTEIFSHSVDIFTNSEKASVESRTTPPQTSIVSTLSGFHTVILPSTTLGYTYNSSSRARTPMLYSRSDFSRIVATLHSTPYTRLTVSQKLSLSAETITSTVKGKIDTITTLSSSMCAIPTMLLSHKTSINWQTPKIFSTSTNSVISKVNTNTTVLTVSVDSSKIMDESSPLNLPSSIIHFSNHMRHASSIPGRNHFFLSTSLYVQLSDSEFTAPGLSLPSFTLPIFSHQTPSKNSKRKSSHSISPYLLINSPSISSAAIHVMSSERAMPTSTKATVFSSGIPPISIKATISSSLTLSSHTRPIVTYHINSIKVLAGKLTYYSIPSNLLYDFGDGNTRNLTLPCKTAKWQTITNIPWVSFNNTSQTLRFLPLQSDYLDQRKNGNSVLHIKATDCHGFSVTFIFTILVLPIITNIQFVISITILTNYERFIANIDARLEVIDLISRFYGDSNTNSVLLVGIENGSVVLKISNISTSIATCDRPAIQNIVDAIKKTDAKTAQVGFRQFLTQKYPVVEIDMQYSGLCLNDYQINTRRPIYLEYLVPLVIVSVIFLLVVVIFVIYCYRKNQQQKDNFYIEGRKYRKGKPVLLPDEEELNLPTISQKVPNAYIGPYDLDDDCSDGRGKYDSKSITSCGFSSDSFSSVYVPDALPPSYVAPPPYRTKLPFTSDISEV